MTTQSTDYLISHEIRKSLINSLHYGSDFTKEEITEYLKFIEHSYQHELSFAHFIKVIFGAIQIEVTDRYNNDNPEGVLSSDLQISLEEVSEYIDAKSMYFKRDPRVRDYFNYLLQNHLDVDKIIQGCIKWIFYIDAGDDFVIPGIVKLSIKK